jgi:hypothetical protein
MLKHHAPSSPTRPPTCCFYHTILAPDDSIELFFTHSYATSYAGHHWITSLLDVKPPVQIRWQDNNTLTLTHPNGYKLKVHSYELEDLIEYKLNKEEQLWQMPFPDSASLSKARLFYQSSTSEPTAPSKSTDSISVTNTRRPPKRHKSQKSPSDETLITVAQISEELNVAPNKARNILRKANIQKPENGWTFKKDDPLVAKIRSLLAKG